MSGDEVNMDHNKSTHGISSVETANQVWQDLADAGWDPTDFMHGYEPTSREGCESLEYELIVDPVSKHAAGGLKIPTSYDVEYDEDIDENETTQELGGEGQIQTEVPGGSSTKSGQQKRAPDYYRKLEKSLLLQYEESYGGKRSKRSEAVEPDYDVEILTVVASVNLSCHLDLKAIAKNAMNVEYNPRRFSPLIMRLRNPKSTALIFATGKMIVAGTKTKLECDRAIIRYTRILRKLGFQVTGQNYDIQNMSANGNLRFSVRLKDMADDNKDDCISYEPEIFAGLVYSLAKPKVKAIIFVTGAVLMTGAKSEEDVFEAMRTIYPIARRYRNE